MRSILLLEDDANLNRGISLKLEREGYRVFPAFDMEEAREIFSGEEISMVISDITLPDGSGLDFGRWVRERSEAYLLYLTAMDQEIDIINGYDSGADDYITKPFSVAVLTSKVNALMRRIDHGESGLLKTGPFVVSMRDMSVKKDGIPVVLSRTELQLFFCLIEHAGRIVTKDCILERIWGVDGQFVDDNTVTVNISRLKNKLGTDCISNVRGLGYIWTAEVIEK